MILDMKGIKAPFIFQLGIQFIVFYSSVWNATKSRKEKTTLKNWTTSFFTACMKEGNIAEWLSPEIMLLLHSWEDTHVNSDTTNR